MEIINVTIGKIGSYYIGPKFYLNRNIKLGEIAICVSRDNTVPAKPCVWLVGGIEQIIDFCVLARTKGSLLPESVDLLLSKLDQAKKDIPRSARERLANAQGCTIEELEEMLKLAQVSVTSPISGVYNHMDGKNPTWTAKDFIHVSTH